MSGQVDTNVVAMKFDNAQFQSGVSETLNSLSKLKENLKFSNSNQGLKQLAQSVKNVSLEKLTDGVGTIANKFTTLGIIGVTALQNITSQAVTTGQRLVAALTVDPVKLGFQEYETQINAVQTILANTESKGSTLADVNSALDELNKYADLTIYNFTEMTRNIGTFTAAGVDLDTSVSAIKGIANLAAVSGSTSQQASTAMYQLSQALAAGTVKLMDWNSVVNAGMGGQVFQDALKETARAHGIAIDQMIEEEGSFRETLQKGWLSSEVLTETLSKFTGDLTAEQLKSMNYTDEQIEKIMKMGQTANDAATKVKTFTQLFDTLQEAAQSGWTQTWEILIGDFEEAKALLTAISDTISGYLNQSAEARNNLLQGWKDQGGRTMIIDSLAHGFEVLTQLIAPVKDAMNEIFPPVTVDQLISMTQAITGLINNLTVSEEVAGKIKNTFKGVFSIFKLGVSVVQEIAGMFGELLAKVFPLTGTLLDFTSDLGSKITEVLSPFITADPVTGAVKPIETAINMIRQRLSSMGFDTDAVVERMKDGFSNLADFMGNISNRMSERFGPIKNLAKNLWNAIHDLIENLISSAPSFDEIAQAFDKVFQRLREVINRALEGVNFSEGLDVINTGMLAGLVLMVRNFMKGLKEAKDSGGGESLMDKIKEMFDGLTKCLQNLQATLNATTLLMIASAVGILAASLIGLSLVDSDKLSTALVAITILFGDLFVSLSAFSKIAEGGGLANLTKASFGFIALSTAILILTAAVKNISDLEWEGLAKGLLGIGVVMAELAGFMKLADGLKISPSTGVGLIALAAAMLVMSSAVEKFGQLNPEELAKGLISLSVALAAMAGAMKLLDGVKGSVGIGVGMIAIATAMVILTTAVEGFGRINPEDLARGLFAMATSLIAISGAMQLMSGVKNAVAIGVGLIGVATALLLMSSAVSALGSMDPEVLTRGLFGLASSLLLLSVAVNSMPNNLPVVAASLLVLSSALVVLTGVLAVLGSFDETSIAKSLIALGGSLLILAAAVNAMNGAAKGSAALVVVSAALNLLAIPLMLLGTMSLEQIGTALLGLAGTLALFAGAAILLQPVIPAMLSLAGTLAVFGAACLAVGAGVALLSGALVLLGGSGTAAAVALTAIIVSLASAIPLVLTKIGEGIVAIITTLGNAAGQIATAIGQIVSAILTTLTELVPQFGALLSAMITEGLRVLTEAVPQFGELISTVISEILRVLTEAIPEMANAGLQIIQGILEGIASNIEGIVTAGADCIVNFLNGIQENIGRIIDEGIQTAIAFINGIADGLRNNKEEIWNALENLVTAIIEFFAEGAGRLLEIGGDILDSIGQGISDAVGHIGDFLLGIPGAIADAVLNFDLSQVGSDLLGSIFGSGDNGEQEAKDVGSNISSSTADGIDANAGLVSNSAESSIIDANSAADGQTGSFVSVGNHIASGTAEGINNNSYLVEQAARNMVAKANEAAKNAGEIASPSRLFIREVGQWIPKGVASGITKFSYTVSRASKYMMEGALEEADKNLSDFAYIMNNAIVDDTSPKITPVLDLSDVEAKSKRIDSLLDRDDEYNYDRSFSTRGLSQSLKNTNDITQTIAMNMSPDYNNADVVRAIDKLSKNLSEAPRGDSYYLDGITYDDGSALSNALGEIARATRIERRS